MFLKDIAQPLVAESSSQTTSCLKSGPAYAVAQASGSAFRMTINAVFLEMNKFCARAILPMWPTDEFDKPHSGGEAYSMSFNKDQLYEVCVDDNADADEQALEEERRKLDDALFEEKKLFAQSRRRSKMRSKTSSRSHYGFLASRSKARTARVRN